MSFYSAGDSTAGDDVSSSSANSSAAALRLSDHVPVAVREAVRDFRASPGTELMPPRPGETSFIYAYGVRLAETHRPESIFWVCLASDTCRKNPSPLMLSGGKTSKATRHLHLVHSRPSGRSDAESHPAPGPSSSSSSASALVSSVSGNKRSRTAWLEELHRSDLYQQQPARLYVLLATMRVVSNHLPFALDAMAESAVLRDLSLKQELRHAQLNAAIVRHTVTELYAATRREVVGWLSDNIGRGASFTLTTGLLTAGDRPSGDEYMGVRIHFVDGQFTARSFLLAVRPFQYRSKGLRGPLQRWLESVLGDFGLERKHVFAVTSDGGLDAQTMVKQGFMLSWQPSLPFLTGAATKAACGLVDDAAESENPPLTALARRVALTIYQTKNADALGSLYKDLRDTLYEDQAKTAAAEEEEESTVVKRRVVSLSDMIEQVLLSWESLEDWYNRPRRLVTLAFPLARDYTDLCQLLSLLLPLTNVAKRSDAHGPTQVETFVTLLALRRGVLNCTAPLKDYRSMEEAPLHITPSDLTPLVSSTRRLLRDKFDAAFFHKYTDKALYSSDAFIAEMQLLLHPTLKRTLDMGFRQVVIMCNVDSGKSPEEAEDAFEEIKDLMQKKLTALMRTMGTRSPSTTPAARSAASASASVFSSELDDMMSMSSYASTVGSQRRSTPGIAETETDKYAEELFMWLRDPSRFVCDADGRPESVLSFWRRQAADARFTGLTPVVRVLFAVPSSSKDMQLDLEIARKTVSARRCERTNAQQFVDMCAFLNSNREHIDFEQTSAIPAISIDDHLPSTTAVETDAQHRPEIDDFLASCLGEAQS